MKTINFVMLAKSKKYYNYCVAGIDSKSGEWIRLVSDNKDIACAITQEQLAYENGECAKLLDEMEVKVERDPSNPPQTENWLLVSEKPQKIGELSLSEALRIHQIEEPEYIFGDSDDRIKKDLASKMKNSLALIEVSDFYITENVGGKVKGKFTYNGHSYNRISVTDPQLFDISPGLIFKNALIVVSLAPPYYEYSYKLVAAVYGLDKPRVE